MEVDLEILREKEVAFDRWKDALDLFSIRNRGRTVRIEVKEPGQRDYRVEVAGTVLQGVAVSDDDDAMRTASFFLGQNPAQHARHTVSGVKQVLILSNDKGSEQGIELLSGDNNWTRLIVMVPPLRKKPRR